VKNRGVDASASRARLSPDSQKFFASFFVTAQELPPSLWGRAVVGAVPRRKADREAGKHFFFEKKKQRTFVYFSFESPGETEAEFARFFGSFFQKRRPSFCLPSLPPGRAH
jgi:hypothetical protein